MKKRYTQNELREYFDEALNIFGDFIDSDITRNSVKLSFFTEENAIMKYEEMCRDFPQYLSEPYRSEGYFKSIGASAFVNGNKSGVLVNADTDLTLGEVLQMFLHEIAHLFCTRNEVVGGCFFEKYCMGSGIEDGMINAGYAIWREAIADIVADAAMSDYTTMNLPIVHDEVMRLYSELSFRNPNSKKAMSLIIAYIMISSEIAGTRDWSKAKKAIHQNFKFDDPAVITLLEMVFKKLHTQPFWEITPEFITTLGELYLSLITGKTLKLIATRT